MTEQRRESLSVEERRIGKRRLKLIKKEEVREGERREARLRQKHSRNHRQEWTQFDQLWTYYYISAVTRINGFFFFLNIF